MTFRWLQRTERAEQPVAGSPDESPAKPPLGNLLVFAANSTFWQQRIYAFIRERPHSSLLAVVQHLWPDFLGLPSHRRAQAWFWTKEQLHQLVADGVLCCTNEDDRVALWSLNYASGKRPEYAGCADPTAERSDPCDEGSLTPELPLEAPCDDAPILPAIGRRDQIASPAELQILELAALKEAYAEARTQLVETEASLTERNDELAKLRDIFDKTRENLIRLQLTISELRDERHRLADNALETAALQQKVEQLTAERDRLREQLDLRQAWKS